MGRLAKLPNIGVVVERQLNDVDIFTYEDLAKIGAEDSWLRIQSIDSSACIHRLLALEGAIRNIKKSALPEDRKAELRAFYMAHKR